MKLDELNRPSLEAHLGLTSRELQAVMQDVALIPGDVQDCVTDDLLAVVAERLRTLRVTAAGCPASLVRPAPAAVVAATSARGAER